MSPIRKGAVQEQIACEWHQIRISNTEPLTG